MTVIQFSRRLTDKLRLTIHAACNEGDTLVAERLLCVLGKHIASPWNLPTGVDRRKPENLAGISERVANLQQHADPRR